MVSVPPLQQQQQQLLQQIASAAAVQQVATGGGGPQGSSGAPSPLDFIANFQQHFAAALNHQLSNAAVAAAATGSGAPNLAIMQAVLAAAHAKNVALASSQATQPHRDASAGGVGIDGEEADSPPSPIPDKEPTDPSGDAGNGVGTVERPKRRSRLGGSSVKTAEVWRFFTQLPHPEQAATCSICDKTIKATNSSTTGMIRHLRSCHPSEYKVLQEARNNNLIMKTLKNVPDETMREQLLQHISSNCATESSLSPMAPATSILSQPHQPQHQHRPYSVESIIGQSCTTPGTASDRASMLVYPEGTPQREYFEQVLETLKRHQQTSLLLPRHLGEEIRQKQSPAAADALSSPVAMQLKRPKQELSNMSASDSGLESSGITAPEEPTPVTTKLAEHHRQFARKRRKVKMEGGASQPVTNERPEVVDEVVEAVREDKISDQIAFWLICDKQPTELLSRQGFRTLINVILPGYRLPSEEHFRDRIVPRVRAKFAQWEEKLKENNPFIVSALSDADTSSSGASLGRRKISPSTFSGVSPANTNESGYQEDASPYLTAASISPTLAAAAVATAASSGDSSSFEALVQQSIRSAQNISQSFSHSLELSTISGAESHPSPHMIPEHEAEGAERAGSGADGEDVRDACAHDSDTSSSASSDNAEGIVGVKEEEECLGHGAAVEQGVEEGKVPV